MNGVRERDRANVAPIKMKSVGQELEFVTMETVTHVGEQMQQQNSGRNCEDQKKVVGFTARPSAGCAM